MISDQLAGPWHVDRGGHSRAPIIVTADGTTVCSDFHGTDAEQLALAEAICSAGVQELSTAREEITRLRAELIAVVEDRNALLENEVRLHENLAEAHAGLLQCAGWFRGYGDGHAAKGDTDKAGRNYGREAFARDALGKSGGDRWQTGGLAP